MTEADADRREFVDESAERHSKGLTNPPPLRGAAESVRPTGPLRDSQTTAAAVLESASEGIVIVGPDGAIRLANASAERLFGYRREELVGQPLELLVPARRRVPHAGHRQDYFASPRLRPMAMGLDLTAVRKDGTEFPVDISLAFVDTVEGRLAIACVTDITDRKRTEAELERQREALHSVERRATLGTLAAGVAHQINGLLGIIAPRIELTLTELDHASVPAMLREDLAVIQRNVHRMAQIAQDLLSFEHQLRRERMSVDLPRIVDDTVTLVGRQFTNAGIDLRVTHGADMPQILGDATMLQQMALNLLTNAREALPAGGMVSIETRNAVGTSGWLELVVAGDGPGIAPDIAPRVFDPFFTMKLRGTGLGLSVTMSIVQDHGGPIQVRSEPGRGATFIVTLPAHGAAGPPA